MDERTRHDELPLDPDAEIVGQTKPLHFQFALVAVVALGAFPGTLARYVFGRAWPVPTTAFPTSTFLINVVGAFALGALLEALVRRGDDSGWRRRLRLFVGTGFCGGFTTYSSLAVQSELLVRDHRLALGASYAIVTVLAGLVATVAGIAAAAGEHRRREGRLPLDPDLITEVNP